MPCYNPLQGYRSRHLNASGKRSIAFNIHDGFIDQPITVPCGQCIGCRLERSRQWAIRCVHEASLYDENCFVTLTYDNAHLPDDGSLDKTHFQKFMKRLRKYYGNYRLRYFHCGEYGERFARPHYHLCIFGFDFPDKELWKETSGGKLYISDTLNEIWGKGYCVLGDVTFESAAYVARYITKKITGDKADEHYVDKKTGVLRLPEYITMSRRPGIGSDWYSKYSTDAFPSDFIVIRGKKMTVPKYYDYLYELDCIDGIKQIKRKRKIKMKKFDKDYTRDRLDTRERVQIKNLKLLKQRRFEND